MRLEEFFSKLHSSASSTDINDRVAAKLASQFRDELVERIRKQKFDWPKLSPEYKRWKQRKGLDERILIATESYISSIRARKLDKGKWVVDVPTRLKHESGLTFDVLRRILEFGSEKRNIPPRPHWRPCVREFKNELKNYTKEIKVESTDLLKIVVKKLISASGGKLTET